MVVTTREILWTDQALKQFNSAIKFIKKDSQQNAEKVKQKILLKIAALSDPRIIHRQDPFKKYNDGNFLCFEILRYRVAYYSAPDKVFIIRVRHTSMEPKKH